LLAGFPPTYPYRFNPILTEGISVEPASLRWVDQQMTSEMRGNGSTLAARAGTAPAESERRMPTEGAAKLTTVLSVNGHLDFRQSAHDIVYDPFGLSQFKAHDALEKRLEQCGDLHFR
jgi:hypothetical protein